MQSHGRHCSARRVAGRKQEQFVFRQAVRETLPVVRAVAYGKVPFISTFTIARAVAIAGRWLVSRSPRLADAVRMRNLRSSSHKVAQNGLWKEATYRWEKATELDPTYAAAWNNLGIGYEHEGRFDDARKAYEKAVALDPKNILIRQNYDLFKEINDRAKRRNPR